MIKLHHSRTRQLEKEGEIIDHEMPKIGKGYTYEIEEVHACLTSGRLQSDLWSHKNSSDLAKLLYDVRQKAGIIFPFEEQN